MAEEHTYSIDDIIQGEVELEQEVNVILGATSDQKCTYDEGYIYRQPIFSCVTCSDNSGYNTDNFPGGICLACSLKCHSTHEVEELYTKRNFRCDCGNKSKFGHLKSSEKCLLQPNKSDFNVMNKYSDNYRGLYCVCKKVYEGDCEMIQCVLCEDWFHIDHCGVECTDQIDELICPVCMSNNPFLYYYVDAEKTREATLKVELQNENVEIEKDDQNSIQHNDENSSQKFDENIDENFVEKIEENSVQNNSDVHSFSCEGNIAVICIEKPVENIPEQTQLKRKIESYESDAKRVKPANACKLENFNKIDSTTNIPGIFSQNWRENLCKCHSCLKMYKNNKIEFLMQTTDTIQYYEQQAKDTNSFTDGVNAFSKLLNPTQRVELTYQFNSMKEELSEFLRPFAREGKAVSKDDIYRFFEELTKKKESFNDVGIPPSSCK